MIINLPFKLPRKDSKLAESFNATTNNPPFFNPFVPAVHVLGQANNGL